MLESIIESKGRGETHDLEGLEAVLSCYLALKGAGGLELLEE